jgi:hypothetical protein
MILSIIILSSLFFIILTPVSAWAWGPATHLEIAHTILSSPGLVTGGLRDLILSFPHDFIYGSVSADIVVGKNLVDELRHCHNWRIGRKVFERAGGNAEKAFACGYLSHLAADTVAHNDFIPEMMIRSFPTRALKHLYWELRFDALAGKEAWDLQRVLTRGAKPENHRLLDSVITGTPLSFTTNRAIFSSFMLLNRVRHWQKALRLMDKSSSWPLPAGTREKYLQTSIEAAAEVLSDMDGAGCLEKDPTGKKNLRAAGQARKRLKSTLRTGGDWRTHVEEALRGIDL